MFKRADADKWIRSQLYHIDYRPNAFVLRQLVNGKMGNDITRVSVPEQADDAFIEATIDEMERFAHEDATAIGGMQTYALYAYVKDLDRSPSRFPFREAPRDSEMNEAGTMSETPDKAGLLGQLMRHNEAITKSLVLGMGNTINSQARIIDSLTNKYEKVLDARMNDITAVEQLLSLNHERQLQTKEMEHKLERDNKIYEKVLLLGPALVNRLAGKKLIPEQMTPMEIQLGSIIKSLSLEQLQGLQKSLNADQYLALLNVIKVYQDAEEPSERTPNGSATEKN